MKKVALIIVVSLLACIIVSCANNTQTNNNDISSSDEMSNEKVQSPTEKPTEDVNLKVATTNQYNIISGDAFVDDVAWVTLQKDDSNSKVKALINTRGEILYFPSEEYKNTLPFVNGLSAVYGEGHGFIIINTLGEEVYSVKDENTVLCGQTQNGSFLIANHDSGFDHDVWYLNILDSDLSLNQVNIEIDKNYLNDIDNTTIVTENIYCIGNSRFININTKKSFKYLELSLVGKNDEYVCYYLSHSKQSKPGSGVYDMYGYYMFPISLLSELGSTVESEEKMISEIRENNSVIHYDYSKVDEKAFKFSKWKNGSFYRAYVVTGDDHSRKKVYEYTDMVGNVIVSFPEFSDGITYTGTGMFKGDYCAIYLKGVDKKKYISIIDSKGEMQFEPMLFDSKDYTSCNGYVFSYSDEKGIYDIITPNGEHKKLGDNLDGLTDMSYTSDDFLLSIGCGFILCKDSEGAKLYSTNGGKKIEKITANYNSKGNLIFTDKDGKKHFASKTDIQVSSTETESSTNKSNQPTTAQKNYSNPSNFNIKGKWKNIGEGTYGQAQKDSIISFDGKNCNFVSPKDTYAFYKDGNEFKLDCTTPLADTVSFTVKIIDNNNIDITNDYWVVELKRVN